MYNGINRTRLVVVRLKRTGEYLRRQREQCGLTIADAAGASQGLLTAAGISKIESGEKGLNLKSAYAFARLYGINIEQLIEWEICSSTNTEPLARSAHDLFTLDFFIRMMPFKRIEIDTDVMFGKPVVKGTRIPVESILKKVSEGWPHQRILEAYPRLVVEDIRECVDFARCVLEMSHQALDRDEIKQYLQKQKQLENVVQKEMETA